jgi:hypothetical protein
MYLYYRIAMLILEFSVGKKWDPARQGLCRQGRHFLVDGTPEISGILGHQTEWQFIELKNELNGFKLRIEHPLCPGITGI